MTHKATILLVGDVVSEDDSPSRTWFDEDRPAAHEVEQLVQWFAEAEYPVDVCDSVRQFVETPPPRERVVVFPLWRGGASRNRTAVVPALCEARGIAYVGGDAFVQTVCQDKSISKLCTSAAGFRVPAECVLRSIDDVSSFHPSARLQPPFVVKPVYSAASIGVTASSLCHTDRDAVARAIELFDEGLGPVVCEEFVPGDEVSLCFIEEAGRIVRRCVATFRTAAGQSPFLGRLYTYADKVQETPPWNVAALEGVAMDTEWAMAETLIRTLGKVDYMRIDGRLDANGQFVVIELTPDIHLGLTSCFLGSFASAGIYPAAVLDQLVKASLRNWKQPTAVAWLARDTGEHVLV
jgi:D-alanine-D-alanine ligase